MYADRLAPPRRGLPSVDIQPVNDDRTRAAIKRRNAYEVTEEFYLHNGHYGTREDVVFLINGIPVLVIECKNATKDEAIALGVDQVRRYHAETPELFVKQRLPATYIGALMATLFESVTSQVAPLPIESA